MALRVCVRSLISSNRLRLWGEALSLGSMIRPFSRQHALLSNSSLGSKVLLHFVNQSGTKTSVMTTEGESLLDVVINKNLQIDGFGACEGTLACSTCHLLFEESVYERLEPMADEEMDMLDLAYGLTKTSRLGCQVIVAPWMNGMMVRVPQGISDQRVTQEAKNNQ
ncbi:ferredoxin 1b [Hemibagrus wyckioides]|uniref:ferredoxin 1b n=1 Tax=Hemibagrus wyckioides TaxID=337641 RepID=UPI00266B4E86|nr:ferredoxin 1b [Hemibagrus wyckioides]